VVDCKEIHISEVHQSSKETRCTSSPSNLGQYYVLLKRLCHFSSCHINTLKNAQLILDMGCYDCNACNLANIRRIINTNQGAKTFSINLCTHYLVGPSRSA
jgi:hypothetical protein